MKRFSLQILLPVTLFMSESGCLTNHRSGAESEPMLRNDFRSEQQVTHGLKGRVLTNTGAWSPDGEWLVYDTRFDAPGDGFNGLTIEAVNIYSGEVREIYRAKNGAHCGVVTFHPKENKVIFILGPEFPTPDWQYTFYHRQGVIVGADLGRERSGKAPGEAVNVDACD